MSDLLAPVLCEIKCEAEAFWCFVGLMQRTIFVCTPTDNDMDNNLVRFLNTHPHQKPFIYSIVCMKGFYSYILYTNCISTTGLKDKKGLKCIICNLFQSYLRELIRLMLPHFYKHLEKHIDAMELLFCHRWILL